MVEPKASEKLMKTEWDLSAFLQNDDDPVQEEKNRQFLEANSKFVTKWKERKDYLTEPQVLKAALDEFEQLNANFSGGGEVGFYFILRTCLDQNDPGLKAKLNKINDLNVRVANSLEFFTNRLAKIPQKKQQEFLDSPLLSDYKHFLEMLFWEAKYLLSEDEEKILNLMSTTSYSNWVKMTADFLSKEERKVICDGNKRVEKHFAEIWTQTGDKNKTVRDSAARAFNAILEKYSDVAEIEINSILKSKKISDDLRKMARPDQARHIADDIDTKAVDSLLEAVESRFDISRSYYKLKAKLMGLKKLNYHDRNVEYGAFRKKFSYEEAVDLVGRALDKLDPEFNQIFANLVENGRIDVFPKKGKEPSESCISSLKNKPTFILLNYVGKLEDVTTLAHETGHAINDELIKQSQNALNMVTPLSTAEVASTFMEDFVLDEISEGISDKEKLTLCMKRLNDSVSAIMRQVACYRFEQELHKKYGEKGYLSKGEIGEIFQKHMRSYMGSYVEQSEGSQNWWIHWSHIRDYFYVYSYASGELIAKYLQNSVKENHAFIVKVKEFMKSGASDSPRDIFYRLGIDIDDENFWLEGLEEISDLLKYTYKLAKKLHKI